MNEMNIAYVLFIHLLLFVHFISYHFKSTITVKTVNIFKKFTIDGAQSIKY